MRPGSFGKIAPRLIMKKAHDVETKVSLLSHLFMYLILAPPSSRN